MDIRMPQLLYHGTTDDCADSFAKKLLDRTYWKPGRDFGEGFYTTTSAEQARRWARKSAAESYRLEKPKPCVLVIELTSVPADWQPLIFMSGSHEWAKFIFDHRKVRFKGADPCASHPDFIMGPMADNDTGKVMVEAVKLNQDAAWFYEQITRSRKGRKLDDLQLGNQAVFASESWEASLRLKGTYIFIGRRWSFHEHASEAESI